MSTLTLLVLFLEHRIRDKANPLSARSAHKFWGDENILIQTKESQVQRTVLRMCFFPPFSLFLFPWYLEPRRLLGEFITSGIFKDREPEVCLAFSFQGKSPRSVWYVHEWHEKKAVRGEGEDMPRIVNYEKKNCLSKRVMCLALFPRWSSAFWLGPLPHCEFSGSALGLGFSDPPVTTGHLVSWGSLSTCSTSDSCGICALICLEETLIFWVLGLGDSFQEWSGLVVCYTQC